MATMMPILAVVSIGLERPDAGAHDAPKTKIDQDVNRHQRALSISPYALYAGYSRLHKVPAVREQGGGSCASERETHDTY